jgi:hypothetical protein
MKAKSFLGIVLSVALAMVAFGGCADDTWGGHNLVEPVVLLAEASCDLRGTIADEVNASRAMSVVEHRADSGRSVNRISEITEFYFPTIEIDGFELYSVAIFDSALVYIYARIGRDNDFGIGISGPDSITIFIDRTETLNEQGRVYTFAELVENSVEQGFDYHTESRMLHSPDSAIIVAPWGDTSVRIDVPQELNTYEFLRDLALRVIETMELVTV